MPLPIPQAIPLVSAQSVPYFLYASEDDVQSVFSCSSGALTPAALQTAIKYASALIESYTQRILGTITLTETMPLLVNRYNQVVGKVHEWPITGVSSVSVQLAGSTSTIPLDITQVVYDMPPDRLFWYSGPIDMLPNLALGRFYFVRGSAGWLSVTYTAGFSPIPADINYAAILIAQDILTADSNPIGATSLNFNAMGTSSSFSFAQGQSMNLGKAYAILERYKRRDT